VAWRLLRTEGVIDMYRRVFLGRLTLGALAVAQVAPAQPTRKVARIGVLTVGSTTSDMVGPQPRSAPVNALLRGLHELGYVYGEHFVTEARGGEGRPERFPELAAELVGLRMDVVVAPGPMLSALKQATSTIPIVMAGALDPIAQGLVKSLGQPGGNFTGFSLQSADTAAKRLELVKELVPTAKLVAVLWERTVLLHWQVAEAAARERGWKLLPIEIRDAGAIEGAVRAATDARAGALLVLAGGILYPQSRRIAELVTKSRLPAIYSLRPQVEAGGLMSYGADPVEIWRRAAVFVDKILKGANPAHLPVEQPTKFELVINLKAAKSIGLTIPQSVLLRVDHVVQ
jgi:putative tryptophan/tyrosine transport system substrate-binding protein